MSRPWRQLKQAYQSFWLRRRGIAQPTMTECRAARERVQTGTAGVFDGGKVQRDHCLARGYCCRCGCRYCPWGFDVDSGTLTGVAPADRPWHESNRSDEA